MRVAAVVTAALVAVVTRSGVDGLSVRQGPRVSLADAEAPLVAPLALPLPETTVTRRDVLAPHHDYPASDLMVPVGTPVFAAAPGRADVHDGERCGFGVSIAAPRGYRFVYCHLSVVSIADGAIVGQGDVLGLSGDSGNARGVPHLHFDFTDRAGTYLCPQPLLIAWFEGREPPPAAWRKTDGCSFPRD
ncbi:MAG TPA: M23 family metallopeptidase [Acidimicrobiia bacterium]|nr:M23 family metallopeptidase [Acidimicrobiia bacterium]